MLVGRASDHAFGHELVEQTCGQTDLRVGPDVRTVDVQVCDPDVRRVCGSRYRTPRWVAPLWMVLLALQVERRLRRFQVHTRGGEEGDARRGQPLFERRPNRRFLSGEGAASFVHRAEAARQEPVAVDDHLSVATSMPVTTGITEPPTSIL